MRPVHFMFTPCSFRKSNSCFWHSQIRPHWSSRDESRHWKGRVCCRSQWSIHQLGLHGMQCSNIKFWKFMKLNFQESKCSFIICITSWWNHQNNIFSRDCSSSLRPLPYRCLINTGHKTARYMHIRVEYNFNLFSHTKKFLQSAIWLNSYRFVWSSELCSYVKQEASLTT